MQNNEHLLIKLSDAQRGEFEQILSHALQTLISEQRISLDMEETPVPKIEIHFNCPVGSVVLHADSVMNERRES